MPTEKNNENIGNDYFSRHTKLDIYFIITTCTIKVSPPKVAERNFKSQSTKSLTLLNLLGTQVKETQKPVSESMRIAALCMWVCVFVCVLHYSCYFIFIFQHLTLVFSSSNLLAILALMPHFFCLNSLLYISKLKSIHLYFISTVQISFFPLIFESCSSAWSCRDANIQAWPLDQCCSIKDKVSYVILN